MTPQRRPEESCDARFANPAGTPLQSDRHPSGGTRFRVTIEPAEESEEERRQSLKDDIAAGLNDADAGRVTDGEHLFERLIAKYAKADKPGQD